jgi:exodeoxyribonuclease VII large subunit
LQQPIARGLDRAQELAARMQGLARRRVADAARTLESAGQMLESLSYERVLDRGYALVHDQAGAPVTSVTEIKPAADVSLRFRDGEVGARITGKPGPKRRRKYTDDDQGKLL